MNLAKNNIVGVYTYTVTIFGYDLGLSSAPVVNPTKQHEKTILKSVRCVWRPFCKVNWNKI